MIVTIEEIMNNSHIDHQTNLNIDIGRIVLFVLFNYLPPLNYWIKGVTISWKLRRTSVIEHSYKIFQSVNSA